MTSISNTPVSDFDAAVRLISGGTNVAIYNDLGLPSIYVRRDRGLISDVITGGPSTTHYAFIVNGAEIPAFYMGKYLATVYKGRALSLPLQDPAAGSVTDINRGTAPSKYVTFDNAKIWCEANGAGFHLPTIAEYAWLALLCDKNGTPRGNTGDGWAANIQSFEKGVRSHTDSYTSKGGRTLTGSGPASWNDNLLPDGICDLVGNVCEWQAGYRTVNGELQIFPDNDAAMQYSQAADSTLWKAILQDGTLVPPGTVDTLKWDFFSIPDSTNNDAPFRLNTKLEFQQTSTVSNGMIEFRTLTAASGVIVPERLKALALMPRVPYGTEAYSSNYGNDYVYMKNLDERFVYRGGKYSGRENDTGMFVASGRNPRSFNDAGIGFRCAFIPGI
jgi:hypothetical protein